VEPKINGNKPVAKNLKQVVKTEIVCKGNQIPTTYIPSSNHPRKPPTRMFINSLKIHKNMSPADIAK
jgi:hypothetical protein